MDEAIRGASTNGAAPYRRTRIAAAGNISQARSNRRRSRGESRQNLVHMSPSIEQAADEEHREDQLRGRSLQCVE